MITRFFFLLCSVLSLVCAAEAQLYIRVSIKLILDENGNRPPGGRYNTPEKISEVFTRHNQLLDSMGRGYQFQLSVVELNDVSRWFQVDARNEENKDALQEAAKNNRTLYAWRESAVNVYINNSSSGICSLPGDDDIIFVGATNSETTIFHEIGHFMDLCHTQGCDCNGCDDGCTSPKDDDIGDTIEDLHCWDTNDISRHNFFGLSYNDLPAPLQKHVDNVWFNIMSYHPTRDRLTSDQLDRLTDTANGARNNVVSGRTYFVDKDSGCLFQVGSLACPTTTVRGGIGVAGSGDIVLIRPGHYHETGIFKRVTILPETVTLRATRGDVVIGIP